jgi:hypothetical protein
MSKITKKAHAGRGSETKWEIPGTGIMNRFVLYVRDQTVRAGFGRFRDVSAGNKLIQVLASALMARKGILRQFRQLQTSLERG